MRETSSAVLMMAEATIPVTTLSRKKGNGRFKGCSRQGQGGEVKVGRPLTPAKENGYSHSPLECGMASGFRFGLWVSTGEVMSERC
ncbi:hypothetical protein TNCV_3925211 [Trichonephila clavipes]|nr:hypothetical protein TNCV_3925211 [Trichonephila clavipes]